MTPDNEEQQLRDAFAWELSDLAVRYRRTPRWRIFRRHNILAEQLYAVLRYVARRDALRLGDGPPVR